LPQPSNRPVKPERKHGRLKVSLRLAPWVALGVMLSLWPRDPSNLDAGGLAGMEHGRGRHAGSPGEIPAAGWKDILWRTWSEFNDDRITTVAASVAFFGILALFPGMAAFVSLYGMFADVSTAQKHLALLAGVLPADSLTFIGGEMIRVAATKQASLSATFGISLVLSLWSANAGIKSLFHGLNVAYEEREKRGFVRLNLITLGFTIAMLAFVMLAMIAMVGAPVALEFFNLDAKSRLLAATRWPLLVLVVVAGLSITYRFGPSREHPRWRWVTWGGVVAAFGWLGVSLLFSWYVGSFGHYSITYGSLGAVIGFMTWMWLSVTVILLGAELNAEMEHQTVRDSTTGEPLPMGVRGARMADTLGKSTGGAEDKQSGGWLSRLWPRARS
jgi:membrane protein